MAHSLSRYLTIGLLTTASFNAFGAGYQIYQGISNAGNAFVGGGAVVEDANLVYNNPAATVFLNGLEISLPELEALVSSDVRVTSSTIQPIDATVAGNNRENAGSWFLIPAGFVSYSFLHHQFAVGLGVASPFGLVTDYTNAFQGRYIATHSRLTTIDISPTIAWQPFRCFSIGAGFDAQYLGSDIREHIFTGTATDGNLISKLHDWAYGWNAGLFYRIDHTHTNLAVTYRSRIKHKPDGRVTLDVPETLFASGHGSAHVTNPDFAEFTFDQGFRYGLSLLGTVGWTHWSLVKQIPEVITGIPNIPGGVIDLNFGDSWRYGLAGNFRPNECWKLRLGVMYDQSVTGTNARTLQVPTSSAIILGFGANYKINRMLSIDAAYDHYFFNAGSLDQTVTAGPGLVSNVTADVRSNINVFGLQLNMKFL